MSKNSLACLSDVTCTEKCKFKFHGNSITSAITKLNVTDYQLACYISSICRNYAQVLDDEGRSALHVAASCGRRDLCYWLIKAGKADFNLKDLESGYTALHRSIFYGHINNAVFFIEMGAQTQAMDRDDLQPADHAMKDKLFKEGFSLNNPCQVYVWGTNNNYTLGIGNQHSRAQPELLDFFRKNNISIKQVAMDKFHSVFVSSGGRVWACGHGQGGRLGVGSEQTVLSPQPLKTGTELVAAASVGKDHTVLLMESGAVWTCGSNTYHVLGHNPPPSALLTPRPINLRLIKTAEGPIVGVVASRFHTVLWSETGLWTFGLNGGQLGHHQPSRLEKTIVVPKQVTGLSLGEKVKIMDVDTSVGAVVVSVTKGDIYLLHNYQVRRIASKILDATRVAVFGGELNPEVDPKLMAKGGEEVKVMVLTSTGKLLLWQESFPQMTRCIYPLKRSLTFCGISMCLSSVLLITKDGEAYIGRVKPKQKKKSIVAASKTESMSFNQFIEKVDCHHITISRVPYVHRAVYVNSDPKGQNFVVIQENPKVNLTDIPLVDESEFPRQMTTLLEEAHEDDSLHDLLIQIDHCVVPAHQFVLAQASEEVAGLPRSASAPTIKLSGISVQVLKQVLAFAYTHNCDIIHPGPVHHLNFKGDVIKTALEVAKKLKMPKLTKCLQNLRFEEGIIYTKEGEPFVNVVEPIRFERSMFPSLYDVSITSSDGASFKAHKCVLSARLDYFNSMFTGGWIETGPTTSMGLPIPQTILREVLDFIYKDEALALMESQDTDYISSVMVVADQFFIKRLKQICEVALSCNLSLRNAAYLLQFAITYHAEQLKNCSMQFICINLAAVLETRILEILDNSTLEELSRYYRRMVSTMCKRIMTPFNTQLSEEEMAEIAETCAVSWIDSGDVDNDSKLSTKSSKSNVNSSITKKKTTRSRKTSESQRKRMESVSSGSDLDCSIEPTPTEKVDFDDLVELSDAVKPEEWVTIDKTQKTVQNRLKVITTAFAVQPTVESFTHLVPAASPHSWTHSQPQNIASSPPLQDSKHFPELSINVSSKISSSPKSSFIEIKRSPPVKLSQKQRKRLVAEGGSGFSGSGVVKEEVSPPVPVPVRASAWAPVTSVDTSLADIMKTALTVGSPPSEKGQGMVKFADIMADEIQQRDNWSKMKSKSLHLTQIEDKAMEDLHGFYNTANVFDERITVERVISANIAKPMWITSRHQ